MKNILIGLMVAAGVAGCSSTATHPDGQPVAILTKEEIKATQTEMATIEAAGGALKLVIDDKGDWIKITANGGATVTGDSPRAKEAAIQVATLRAKKVIAEFMNNGIRSEQTMKSIAHAYSKSTGKQGSSQKSSSSEEDDLATSSVDSDNDESNKFARSSVERISASSQAMLRGAYVSARSVEGDRAVVEVTASRVTIEAAKKIQRAMSGSGAAYR